MKLENTHYGLRVEWGDGDVDYIYCDEADVMSSALQRAYRTGGKAVYAQAFEEGQRDAYSRRDIATRHEREGKMANPFIGIVLTMRLWDWVKLLEFIEKEDYPIEHIIRNAIIEHYRDADLKERARTK